MTIMKKSCTICGGTAEFLVKDSTQASCRECAVDCFRDISFLQKVEEQAKIVREKQRGGFKLVEKKMIEDTLARQKESLKTYKGNQAGREQLENSIKATERLLEFKKVNEKGQTTLSDRAGKAYDR